ncbi:alginate O-acetyltransferase AlgX-related protein [Paenibacillus macerans]|uniref:alginate O-acetyltransferase AlgX-related protein n=1 Tax=Paenibacillus macerans TaxID=44252 RepID=UPI00203AF512|nr:hypothetical protein [Paenibacillus macerans]MCM3701158.1 hypothetical protein [Paenibacillus macerans]
MKAHKVFNVVIAIIFLLAISLPLVMVNKTQGRVSVAENRVLAKFPDFTLGDGKLNTHFIKEFEAWFNDNLGFRDKFVQENTKIQYNLFGRLTKADTLVGKNEWLYYVTPEIIADYQHLNLPSDQQLKEWGDSLEKTNNYLKGKEIPFIVMLNPDKKTIYPENYPDTILKVGDISRSDLIDNYFKKNTNLDYFTPKDQLLKAKSKATVYSPRYDNGHWNNYGAFIGYTELMKRVRKYYPDIKVISWKDFDISEYQRENIVYNAISFPETDYAFNYKEKRLAHETSGVLDNLNLSTTMMAVSYKNSNSKLPRALILGDSYLYGFMTPNLAESFSETYFIYSDNINRIKDFVEIFNPDIVIYENVERSFEKTMNILSTSTEFMEYEPFKNLPVISTTNPMWLDYFNNELVQNQENVILDKTSGTVSLNGWAIDPRANDVANSIFLKIGDKYYPGSYGESRTSVSEYFKNTNLTNSGFTFNVNAEELIKAGKISFIIISKDKTYQYAPVEYKVVTK